jgi:uncharacterized membrane protein
MKTLVSIILALGIGFAAAYVVVTQQKNAELKKLQTPQLQAAGAPAPEPAEKIVTMAAPSAPAEESPSDILNDLLDVKLATGAERNSGLRLIVYKLETLAQRSRAGHPLFSRKKRGRGLQPARQSNSKRQSSAGTT